MNKAYMGLMKDGPHDPLELELRSMTTMNAPPAHTFLRPQDADKQAIQAIETMQRQNAAGIKAATEACGKEFAPPTNLVSASKIIAHLRKERDELKTQNLTLAQRHQEAQTDVVADVRAAIAGKPVGDKSPILPLARTIDDLRANMVQLIAQSNAFFCNVRNTLTDRSMVEIPGMAGYFTSGTPLQIAAEGGAVWMTMQDRVGNPELRGAVMKSYLQRRGWRMVANGSWAGPGADAARGALPLDSAVTKQVREDVKPFAVFGTKEWKGVAEKALKPAGPPIIQSTGPTAEDVVVFHRMVADDAPQATFPHGEDELETAPLPAEIAEGLMARVYEAEPDGKSDAEVLPMVADAMPAVGPKPAAPVAQTKPVQPAGQWRGRNDTAETFVMPRLGGGMGE